MLNVCLLDLWHPQPSRLARGGPSAWIQRVPIAQGLSAMSAHHLYVVSFFPSRLATLVQIEIEDLQREENSRIALIFPGCSIPQQPLDLLDKMLTLDPKKRPTCSEALRHPYVKDVDPTKVSIYSFS